MKLLTPLLIIAALVQTSFLPVNIVLVILICKSYLYEEKSNYFLAFLGGIILSVLSSSNLGFWPLILLLVVKTSHILRKLPIVTSIFTASILVGIILILLAFMEQFLFKKSIAVKEIIWGTLFSLPIYFILQIWQDRLLFRHDIKLKIRN